MVMYYSPIGARVLDLALGVMGRVYFPVAREGGGERSGVQAWRGHLHLHYRLGQATGVD